MTATVIASALCLALIAANLWGLLLMAASGIYRLALLSSGLLSLAILVMVALKWRSLSSAPVALVEKGAARLISVYAFALLAIAVSFVGVASRAADVAGNERWVGDLDVMAAACALVAALLTWVNSSHVFSVRAHLFGALAALVLVALTPWSCKAFMEIQARATSPAGHCLVQKRTFLRSAFGANLWAMVIGRRSPHLELVSPSGVYTWSFRGLRFVKWSPPRSSEIFGHYSEYYPRYDWSGCLSRR